MKTTNQGTTRKDREAEALRDNLARRKAQSRSRAITSGQTMPEPAQQNQTPPEIEERQCR
jgi:hypothetical protein